MLLRSARRAALAAALALLTTLAYAVVVLTSTASAAPTSPLLYDRAFDVDVTAESTTTYKVPRHYANSDCYHRYWYEDDAHQSWKIRSKKRSRIGAISSSPGVVLFLRLGGDVTEAGVAGTGKITRRSSSLTGADPGPCGGGTPARQLTGGGCGTLNLAYDLELAVVSGTLTLKPLQPREPVDLKPRTFSDCSLVSPLGVSDGGWDQVEGKLSATKLMSTKRALTVKGLRIWRDDIAGTEGFTETTTKWTVTFRPRGKARR